VTPSDAPCKGVRPIGVSIPNIAFVEGDPVAFENFLDLVANLLGTERPIGRLFQGESLLSLPRAKAPDFAKPTSL
jgi:hypothetical protein